MTDVRKVLLVLAVMATGALAAMPFQKGKRADRPMRNALPEDLVLRRDVDWQIGLGPTSIRGPNKNGNTRRANCPSIRDSGRQSKLKPPKLKPLEGVDLSWKPPRPSGGVPRVPD